MLSLSLRRKAPRSRFSCTVRSGKIRRPSGTWLMPSATILFGLSVWMGCPRKSTSPLRGGVPPQMVISVVLLPAPLAPMSVTISPSLMRMFTSRRAWMLP